RARRPRPRAMGVRLGRAPPRHVHADATARRPPALAPHLRALARPLRLRGRARRRTRAPPPLAPPPPWPPPPPGDARLGARLVLDLDHASYLVAGFLLWWPVFQDEPWPLPSGGKGAYLFAAFVLPSH